MGIVEEDEEQRRYVGQSVVEKIRGSNIYNRLGTPKSLRMSCTSGCMKITLPPSFLLL
jgi:hypothetical protein